MTKRLIDEATVTLALEALETSPMSRKNKDAIDALRETLAEQPAQQEFVLPGGGYVPAIPAQQALDKKAENARELGLDYEPAQRKPLTVAEVEQILAQHNYEIHGDRARYIVRMTEFAHGIKENT